ncbi:MAG: 3'-5' exonuclease [Bacteroidales bacterium]|nr:3'-5' exonuclease [Bacteroidales bacterium]
MLSEINIQDVLFLDIETVPAARAFEDLDPKMQAFWEKKSSFFRTAEQDAAGVYQRAGIYAEFGRIVCISVGIVNFQQTKACLRLKSYASGDEAGLLNSFNEMLNHFCARRKVYLCAHNGKEFDFPYMARRMLINGIKLPDALDIAGRKPWEVNHLDTMELWKFGDYKHYTSLDLLTALFDIPSPKDDIDGSQVAAVFYEENNLPRIVTYCQQDVVAVTQLLLRYMGMELIREEDIEIAG